VRACRKSEMATKDEEMTGTSFSQIVNPMVLTYSVRVGKLD
jgi:hypothetical protein